MNWSIILATAIALLASPGATIVLREQAWTEVTPHLARDLTREAGECVRQRTPQTEIGRALFRTPVLLGGPAARIGLSCNACHSGGRVNARFMLDELTNRPGAADTTSEWASKVRGDGVMNPRDIPDLSLTPAKTSFGHLNDPSLDHFVGSVVTEEFQGHEPPPQAFANVIAYIRAQDPASCAPMARVTLRTAADDVRRAVTAAQSADAPTARLVLLAAQDSMGRIVERLPAPRFADDRARLEALSRELGAMRDASDIAATLEVSAPGWQTRFDAAISRIRSRESRTYFNEGTLRRALGRQT